jgi:hypothetical protein
MVSNPVIQAVRNNDTVCRNTRRQPSLLFIRQSNPTRQRNASHASELGRLRYTMYTPLDPLYSISYICSRYRMRTLLDTTERRFSSQSDKQYSLVQKIARTEATRPAHTAVAGSCTAVYSLS